MPEIRQIQRESFRVPSGDWPGGVGGVLTVGTLTPSPAAGATILRSISFPSVHVSVGAPGAGTPPEDWWSQAEMTWLMWQDSTLITSPPPYGDEPSVLFCGRLQPTLVASPSAPTEYYVHFQCPPEGFQSRGQRKANTGVDQHMFSGLRWEDPLGGLNTATYSSISVDTRSIDICVFGVGP